MLIRRNENNHIEVYYDGEMSHKTPDNLLTLCSDDIDQCRNLFLREAGKTFDEAVKNSVSISYHVNKKNEPKEFSHAEFEALSKQQKYIVELISSFWDETERDLIKTGFDSLVACSKYELKKADNE